MNNQGQQQWKARTIPRLEDARAGDDSGSQRAVAIVDGQGAAFVEGHSPFQPVLSREELEEKYIPHFPPCLGSLVSGSQ